MYAWIDRVAQSGGLRGSGGDGSFQVRAWQSMNGADGPGARTGDRLFPVLVAGLNRAGLGPLRADIRGEELRRAALRASEQVLIVWRCRRSM